MIVLRTWLGRASWYCLFALIANFLIALSIVSLPMDALIQRILGVTFSIVLLVIAVAILVQAIDFAGVMFEAGVRATGEKRLITFLVGIVLLLFCGALLWLLIIRLHQPLGDFLRGSDAVLMQVEILIVGMLAWRQARRMRIQQQQKKQ